MQMLYHPGKWFKIYFPRQHPPKKEDSGEVRALIE